MKKILILTIIFFAAFTHAQTKQKCSDLPGFKKIGKDSMEYIKCLKSDKKFKLKTDSKVKDWITEFKKRK